MEHGNCRAVGELMRHIAIILTLSLTTLAHAVPTLPVIDQSGDSLYLTVSLNERSSLAEAESQINELNILAGYPIAYGQGIRNPQALYFIPTTSELQRGLIEELLPILNTDEGAEDSWDTSGLAYYRVGMRATQLPHPGDANNDGFVDVVDLAALAAHYDENTNLYWSGGDFNLDGDVDVVDLGILAKNFGWSGASFGSTPEPVTLTLLLLGFVAIRKCA